MDEDEPSYDICVTRNCGDATLDAALIRSAVWRTLELHRCASARIGVALVDDPHIAQLNEQYLNHTGPTDILSFNLADTGDSRIDGEIVISAETAGREAKARNHQPLAEVLLYTVHGTLHLLGMDDATDEQAAQMHRTEQRILENMGFNAVYDTE